MRRVALKDIAEKAGVSTATVSYVLNGKWRRRIREKVGRKVLKIAKELNYQPHASAQALAKGKTSSIAVGFRDVDYLTQSYFPALLSGIYHQVGLRNFNLQFATTSREGREGENLYFLKKVNEKRVDGFIIIDQLVEDKEILKLKEGNVPFVLIDRKLDDAFCVSCDNEKGIYLGTLYLLEKGYRDILFLAEPLSFPKIQEMVRGYKKALKEKGVKFKEENIISSRRTFVVEEFGKREIEKALSSPCIQCSNDKIASGIISFLQKRGKKVPEDTLVMGYNDEEVAKLTRPLLSTIKVPLREMGEKAAEILIDRIEGKDIPTREFIFSPQLVLRESA